MEYFFQALMLSNSMLIVFALITPFTPAFGETAFFVARFLMRVFHTILFFSSFMSSVSFTAILSHKTFYFWQYFEWYFSCWVCDEWQKGLCWKPNFWNLGHYWRIIHTLAYEMGWWLEIVSPFGFYARCICGHTCPIVSKLSRKEIIWRQNKQFSNEEKENIYHILQNLLIYGSYLAF